MDMNKMKALAIGLALVYGVYKFGKGDALKAAALGVGGVMIAKNVPYVRDALA